MQELIDRLFDETPVASLASTEIRVAFTAIVISSHIQSPKPIELGLSLWYLKFLVP